MYVSHTLECNNHCGDFRYIIIIRTIARAVRACMRVQVAYNAVIIATRWRSLPYT